LTGPNTGSKEWLIPASLSTGTYILRIKGTDANGNDTGIMGDSVPFQITDPQGGSITVTRPHSGELLCRGGNYTIKWTKSGNTGINVKINIFRNSISPANFVSPQLTGPNTGSKEWLIPASLSTGTYILRIKGTDANGNDTGVHGDSHLFKIQNCLSIDKGKIAANINVNKSNLTIQNRPDFMVYGEQLDFIDRDNKTVKYHVAVKNKGSKDAHNIPIELKIYLRGNPGRIVKTITYTIPSLPKNMTVAWNKTYQLKEIGTYDFLFKVNPDATVKEYLYNNNSAKRKTISREALPDLVVWLMTTKVDIIARSRVWVGVKNIGQKTSSPTKLKFYIQTKGTKYLDIPPIAPGKFYTAERRPWFHSLKDVWVEMTIDPYHTLREDKERNNYAKKKLKVWSHTIFDK
jgi:hypothetical protein